MKKIIHLCHLNNNERFQQIAAKLRLLCPISGDYVVLITGDIVDKGKTEGAFQRAKELIDQELVQPGYQVLIVPGNHDYGTGIMSSNTVAAEFKKTFYGNANAAFPRLDIVGDDGNQIAFIGLDTSISSFGSFAGADGEIGTTQLKALAGLLKTEVSDCEKVVVYMHHNPLVKFEVMNLDDAYQLKVVLQAARNVDALLFGHKHSGKNACGSWGIDRFYDGGTATAHKGDPSRHRLIDLSKDSTSDLDLDLFADITAAG